MNPGSLLSAIWSKTSRSGTEYTAAVYKGVDKGTVGPSAGRAFSGDSLNGSFSRPMRLHFTSWGTIGRERFLLPERHQPEALAKQSASHEALSLTLRLIVLRHHARLSTVMTETSRWLTTSPGRSLPRFREGPADARWPGHWHRRLDPPSGSRD